MFSLHTYDANKQLKKDGCDDKYFPIRELKCTNIRESACNILLTGSNTCPIGALKFMTDFAREAIKLGANIVTGLDAGVEEYVVLSRLPTNAHTILLPYKNYRADLPLIRAHYLMCSEQQQQHVHKFLTQKEEHILACSPAHQIFLNYAQHKVDKSTHIISWHEHRREPMCIRIAKHINRNTININRSRHLAQKLLHTLREAWTKSTQTTESMYQMASKLEKP